MKKLLEMALACLMLAGILSGCANAPGDEKVEYRWKMALNSTEGDNAYDTGVLFAQKIKELTDGRVQVDLYGGAQLGTTAEVLEGMYAGVAVRVHRHPGHLHPSGQHRGHALYVQQL